MSAVRKPPPGPLRREWVLMCFEARILALNLRTAYRVTMSFAGVVIVGAIVEGLVRLLGGGRRG